MVLGLRSDLICLCHNSQNDDTKRSWSIWSWSVIDDGVLTVDHQSRFGALPAHRRARSGAWWDPHASNFIFDLIMIWSWYRSNFTAVQLYIWDKCSTSTVYISTCTPSWNRAKARFRGHILKPRQGADSAVSNSWMYKLAQFWKSLQVKPKVRYNLSWQFTRFTLSRLTWLAKRYLSTRL